MRPSRSTLLLWIIIAALALLAWVTVTGRLGKSRHGYASGAPDAAAGLFSAAGQGLLLGQAVDGAETPD